MNIRYPDHAVIPKHINWQDVEGELILFNGESGRYHALNEVASSIWRGLSQGRSLASIIEGLSREYGPDTEPIARDVCRFVQEAIELGILVAAIEDRG